MEKRVLIVEDSETIRYTVKMLLEKIGIVLVEAANELGMFNVIEQYGRCVDLIIMDLSLKRENGFDLIEKLKAREKYRNIPVLVLTENADKDSVLRAKGLEVAGYLRKPIRKDELIERVKNVLTKYSTDV